MSQESKSLLESEIYSKAGYAFLLFITDYYKRANEFGLNIDEIMIVHVVAAQYTYKLNKKKSRTFEELKKISPEDIKKSFQGSKLSILSVANILGQPKESVRRRIQKLIDFQLLSKDTNGGIILNENYQKILEQLSSGTNITFSKLVNDLNDMGALNMLLNGRKS
tara:strand:+ start:625 stop:1119 length:495 start_codon:yes stop_codon:yes gene_type:complete